VLWNICIGLVGHYIWKAEASPQSGDSGYVTARVFKSTR
jgi:hypothetical protein